MTRLLALLAGTALLVSNAVAAHAGASTSAGAPLRDQYSTPGHVISIVGRPRILEPTVSVVKVRYKCLPATDVQIGARITGRAVHSNRWARFQYPFTPAVCDGKVHISDVRVNAHPQAPSGPSSTFAPGERVQVTADLIDYTEPIPGVGPLPRASLAGDMQVEVRMTGPKI